MAVTKWKLSAEKGATHCFSHRDAESIVFLGSSFMIIGVNHTLVLYLRAPMVAISATA